MAKLLYADNNATTAVAPEVAQAMRPFFGADFFNPSSMYDPAAAVARALAEARAAVARFLRADPAEILFTGCATESNNHALFGTAAANPARRHVVTTAVEHPAILEPAKELARRGYEVTIVPVLPSGALDVDAFVRAIRPGETLLVSVMAANNETGVLFPVGDLARIVKATDNGILFHTDATQAAGKMLLDLADAWRNVDLLSFSGHKMHAPKGIGVLFVRRGTPIRPFLFGGHQEQGRRGGTENVAYAAGLAAACKLAEKHLADMPRVAALRDRLEKTLRERIPYLEVNGADQPRTPNTLSLAIHFIEGESILYELNEQGICVSTGSACSSGSLEPSHVLRAMKIPFTAMHGSVRLSFSAYTTEEEIARLEEALPAVARALRHLSPYWDQARDAPRAGAIPPSPLDDGRAPTA
jgi:cysteine desulfurase